MDSGIILGVQSWSLIQANISSKQTTNALILEILDYHSPRLHKYTLFSGQAQPNCAMEFLLL